MPSPAVQTEFAAILAENFKKDSTFHSQNSMPLNLQSDPNATSFSPHYSSSNNNTLTLAAQSLPRALQRPFSSTTMSRRDDNGNGDSNSLNNYHNNNNSNNNNNNNNHGHASAYSTRKLVAAKEKSKKVLSP